MQDIFLVERHKWKSTGVKRRLINKQDFVYYVPILKVLEVLLNNQHFADEVCKFYLHAPSYSCV